MDKLRDIHLPHAISWWPPAIGWWMLAFGTCALIIFLFYYFKMPKLKKEALLLLRQIERDFDESQNGAKCMAELSVLLRRVAISKKPECAGTTGTQWLCTLDSDINEPEFSQGAGKYLLTGPYQSNVAEDQVWQTLKLCRKWVEAAK